MRTGRGQCMNRAFETIEVMRDPVHHHFERLVIIVSTNFTSHNFPFSTQLPPISRTTFPPQTFLSRLHLLIVLSICDTLFHQFFGEGLFVRRRNVFHLLAG